jgi:RND family efflux transporter MFP subunit
MIKIPITTILIALSLPGTLAVGDQTELEIVEVTQQLIDVEHRLDGVVEAVNEATLTAEIPGRIAEVLFDVGDVVPAGAVVIRLRGTEQKAEVSGAEAGVVDARARIVEANRNFRRIESLYAQNAASAQALEQAKAAMEVSEASLQVAQAQMTKAEEQAGYAVVRAPYGGVVTERHVERGESVSPGQPLISGFLPDQLRVSVEVPQRLITLVRKHRSARVHLPDLEREAIDVKEISIFPYASAGVGTTRIRLTLPYGVEDLSPGMLVKVSFAVGTRSVLAIPKKAIVFRSEVIGVYVLSKEGKINLRRIRPGKTLAGDKIVVLAGLAEGEQIALDPIMAVKSLKLQAQ